MFFLSSLPPQGRLREFETSHRRLQIENDRLFQQTSEIAVEHDALQQMLQHAEHELQQARAKHIDDGQEMDRFFFFYFLFCDSLASYR